MAESLFGPSVPPDHGDAHEEVHVCPSGRIQAPRSGQITVTSACARGDGDGAVTGLGFVHPDHGIEVTDADAGFRNIRLRKPPVYDHAKQIPRGPWPDLVPDQSA